MASSDSVCDKQVSENHDVIFHEDCLTKLCRLCSSRLNTAKKTKEKTGRIYHVKNYAVAIQSEFGIDVSKDIPGKVHPTSVCNGCRSAMKNFKRNPNSHSNVMKKQDVRDVNCRWNFIGENMSSCFTCHTFTNQTRPGRRPRPIGPLSDASQFIPGESTTCITQPELPVQVPLSNLCEESALSQPSGIEKSQDIKKAPGKVTVEEVMASKGPPTDLDHKLLNSLLDKFDKSNPLIEVKTGGTVSKHLII